MRFTPILGALALALTVPMTLSAQSAPAATVAVSPAELAAAKALVARYAPNHLAQFRLEAIPAENDRDTFEIESDGPVVVLRGSSGVALASAFHKYLNDYCNAQISWNGVNLRLPKQLPAVEKKVRLVSPLKVRLAYNYCTHGYTTAFWDEAQWMAELDRLALNGFNAALIIHGQEAVWQNTFARFGYTKEEMRRWISSPVHFPWQLMGNMHSFEPPSQTIIDARVELGKKILKRCRELGIKPIFQGYYGIIPTEFAKKHPGAKIMPQGNWVGGLGRQDMLHPEDERFNPIAKAFYEEQEKLFGSADLFAADPFHEGGSSKGLNRGKVFKQIQDLMLAHNPRAIFVKQCWQESNKDMFDAGNRDQTLAIDLACEDRPFWGKVDGFSGTPWSWGVVLNFGGNLTMQGNPADMLRDFTAATGPKGRRLESTAMVPEGLFTNPMIYTLLAKMGTEGPPAEIRPWISAYLRARYGEENPVANKAWDSLLASAYGIPRLGGQLNSILTAAPALNDNAKGATWSIGNKPPYSNVKLLDAWRDLNEASATAGKVDTFRFDLADVARQTLTNHSRDLFLECFAAARAKDLAKFKNARARLDTLHKDLEELTGTRAEWLLGKWESDAARFGKNAEDRAYLRRVGRMLLTSWVKNPDTNLRDYANREWHGLIGKYYVPRWNFLFDEVESALKAGREVDMGSVNRKRSAFDAAFVEKGVGDLPSRPSGDTVAISKRLYKKYEPAIRAVGR